MIDNNAFGFIRTLYDQSKTTLYYILETAYIMTPETPVEFDITITRQGLHTLNLAGDSRGESEFCGTLGELRQLRVVDGALLEIHCSQGILRLSLPKSYLDAFDHPSITLSRGDTDERT